MRTSNFILFILLLCLIVVFTKLKNYFPISPLMIMGLILLFWLLKFWEVHRDNKKRNYLVNEIRGNN